MVSLLLAVGRDYGVTPGMQTFLNILGVTCFVVLVLSTIIMIVGIMVTPSRSEPGTSAFTGATNESYYGRNKGKNQEGKLKLLVAICMILVMASSVGLFLLVK